MDPTTIALATDLYQLTMGASYRALGMDETATFSLFARKLPANRSFLVVAGVEEALDRVQAMRFDQTALAYLRSIGQIRDEFLDRLTDFRFSGDIWAVPEGRVVFADEPLLEVQGPIVEAQLAETVIVNAIHFPTLVATKAARCVASAPNAGLIDFGLRRTPSIDAGLAVARAAYLAGFASTSNVLAGERYGIPVAGTVAHSFIEIFPTETEAFRAFAATFPGPVTLLIDTYDTERGAHHAAQVAQELRSRGGRVQAVRIDSGDLAQLSTAVRRILDDAGLPDVQIVASGGLDEHELADLVRAGAPIDAYGVGTKLGTSADAPALDMAYKLVQYGNRPCLKLSAGKETLVGPKQVWRHRGADGRFDRDRMAARDEPSPGAGWEPLLVPVMQGGEMVRRPSLDESRVLHRDEMAALPTGLRNLTAPVPYSVERSLSLTERQRLAVATVREREGLPPRG
jgi:nicotinate phosphoribosyltransferase